MNQIQRNHDLYDNDNVQHPEMEHVVTSSDDNEFNDLPRYGDT